MRIGELARATGIKVETIRFYEAEALLPAPERDANDYRRYEKGHLERLSFIRRSREVGFTLDQVRALLRLADAPDAPCTEVDAITTAHVAEIDRKLTDLAALRGELVQRLESCDGTTVARCRIIEALSPGDP